MPTIRLRFAGSPSTTYALDPHSPIWHDATGSSAWYTTTFSLNITNEMYVGFLNVLADDVTDVYLNGQLVRAADLSGNDNHCQQYQPNCLEPLQVALNPVFFLDGLTH